MKNNNLYAITVALIILLTALITYFEHSERIECYKHNPNNGQVCKGWVCHLKLIKNLFLKYLILKKN